MSIPSNTGYMMLAKQTAQGVVATPSIGIAYLDDGANIAMDYQFQNNGEDIAVNAIKMKHTEKFACGVNARPDTIAYLLAYILGADSVAGGGDPYTHTLTRADLGRPWLTFERGLNATLQQRLYDCKISKLSLSGVAGQPIKAAIEGDALGVVLRTTALTPTYERREPFSFYDGNARFSYAGVVIDTIKRFQIDMTVDALGGLQNGEYEVVDLPDFSFNVDVQLEFFPDTFTNWKNVAYGGGTARAENIYTAALDFDFRYTESAADDRQLKFAIPSIMYKSIGGNTLTSGAGTMTENIAGVAQKLATTELITYTVKNSLAADLI